MWLHCEPGKCQSLYALCTVARLAAAIMEGHGYIAYSSLFQMFLQAAVISEMRSRISLLALSRLPMHKERCLSEVGGGKNKA